MTLSTLGRVGDTNLLIPYSEGYLAIDYASIRYFDFNFQLTDEAFDYFDPDDGFLFGNNLYLKKDDFGISRYDIKTTKREAVYRIDENLSLLGEDFLLSSEGDEILVLASDDEAKEDYLIFLDAFSLTKKDSILLPTYLPGILYIPPLKKYLLYGPDTAFLFQKKGELQQVRLSLSPSTRCFYDEKKKRILTVGGLGVKAYDLTFNEVARYDLISDERLPIPEGFMEAFPTLLSPGERTYPKEEIMDSGLFNDDILAFVFSRGGNKSRLALVSLKDGKEQGFLEAQFPILSLSPYGEKYVIFKAMKHAHVLEVKP